MTIKHAETIERVLIMEKCLVENDKYIIRHSEKGDKEQMTKLLQENKYIKSLWNTEKLKSVADSLVEEIYLDCDNSYCIIAKDTESFCGYMEISTDEKNGEGELSIRVLEGVDIYGIINILGEIFRKHGYANATNATIQFELS